MVPKYKVTFQLQLLCCKTFRRVFLSVSSQMANAIFANSKYFNFTNFKQSLSVQFSRTISFNTKIAFCKLSYLKTPFREFNSHFAKYFSDSAISLVVNTIEKIQNQLTFHNLQSTIAQVILKDYLLNSQTQFNEDTSWR